MAPRREDQFTYIISSDGSADAYPGNRGSNFKIMLKDPIEFNSEEDWEVGLLDFHYPYSWYNVSSDMEILYADGKGIASVKFPDWQCSNLTDLVNYIKEQLSIDYTVKVDPFGRFVIEGKGVYCDVGFSDGLISFLNLQEMDKTYTVTSFRKRARYREIFGEFWIDEKNPMEFDEDLMMIDWSKTEYKEIFKILKEYVDVGKLGTVTLFNDAKYDPPKMDIQEFESNQMKRNISVFLASFKALYGFEDFPPKVIIGEYAPRMNPALQFHIFSNIIQPVDVNDTQAKLMKVVNVKGSPGSMSQEVFTHPTYQPVEKTRKISMIHVYIKNEIGEFVPFVHGHVLMTLHFRRQRVRR